MPLLSSRGKSYKGLCRAPAAAAAATTSRHLATPVVLVLILLPVLLTEWLLPYYSATICQETIRLSPKSVSRQEAKQKDAVLILADIHLDTLCPYSDFSMKRRRLAAQYMHSVASTVILGDLMSFGGGQDGSFNISDHLFAYHAARFRDVVGCAPEELRPKDVSRCVVLPGNHDLVQEPTARWLQSFPLPNVAGRLPGGTTYYLLNSQHPSIPNGTRATLLLSHSPVTHIHDGLVYINPTLPVDNFKLILSGHEHVASYSAASVSRSHNVSYPAEISVPSFNLIRAMLSGFEETCVGKMNCYLGMGFGVLRLFDDESISYQLCTPCPSPYGVYTLWLLFWMSISYRSGIFLRIVISSIFVLFVGYIFLYFPSTA